MCLEDPVILAGLIAFIITSHIFAMGKLAKSQTAFIYPVGTIAVLAMMLWEGHSLPESFITADCGSLMVAFMLYDPKPDSGRR